MTARAVPPVLAGIAIGALTVGVIQDRENAWRRWSDWAENRIRELEAEVARLTIRVQQEWEEVQRLKGGGRESGTSEPRRPGKTETPGKLDSNPNEAAANPAATTPSAAIRARNHKGWLASVGYPADEGPDEREEDC